MAWATPSVFMAISVMADDDLVRPLQAGAVRSWALTTRLALVLLWDEAHSHGP